MTPGLTVVLICAAGGVGAAARLVLDGLIRARTRSTYPIATTTINLTGSLLLGLLSGMASGQFLPETWHIIAGAGLLGGYTTFSTASFETVSQLEDGRYLSAIFNGFGTLVICTCAAAAGLMTGLAITR
jgi:CrcB protein